MTKPGVRSRISPGASSARFGGSVGSTTLGQRCSVSSNRDLLQSTHTARGNALYGSKTDEYRLVVVYTIRTTRMVRFGQTGVRYLRTQLSHRGEAVYSGRAQFSDEKITTIRPYW